MYSLRTEFGQGRRFPSLLFAGRGKARGTTPARHAVPASTVAANAASTSVQGPAHSSVEGEGGDRIIGTSKHPPPDSPQHLMPLMQPSPTPALPPLEVSAGGLALLPELGALLMSMICSCSCQCFESCVDCRPSCKRAAAHARSLCLPLLRSLQLLTSTLERDAFASPEQREPGRVPRTQLCRILLQHQGPKDDSCSASVKFLPFTTSWSAADVTGDVGDGSSGCAAAVSAGDAAGSEPVVKDLQGRLRAEPKRQGGQSLLR